MTRRRTTAFRNGRVQFAYSYPARVDDSVFTVQGMKRKAIRSLKSTLEQHGSAIVSFETLSEWTGEELSPLGRSNMAIQLAEAGFATRPEISNARPSTDEVQIFLIEAAPGQDLAQASPPLIQTKKQERAAARAEKQRLKEEREQATRAKLQSYLDAAAASDNPKTQESHIGQGAEVARKEQGMLSSRWMTWFEERIEQMRSSGTLKRGQFLGHTQHVFLFTDRIVWNEDNTLFVQEVDEHLRASVQTSGQISSRPTLTRMAIGSVLPGTALIPGLAFKKKEDNRELYFVLEHPRWAKIVQLPPDDHSVAQQLVIAVNQAAASAGLDRKQADESARREAEQRARDAEAKAAQLSLGQKAEGASYLEELRELGRLRDNGVLSEEEFSEQKAAVLKRQRDQGQ